MSGGGTQFLAFYHCVMSTLLFPDNSLSLLQDIFRICWSYKHSDRPEFNQLFEHIRKLSTRLPPKSVNFRRSSDPVVLANRPPLG